MTRAGDRATAPAAPHPGWSAILARQGERDEIREVEVADAHRVGIAAARSMTSAAVHGRSPAAPSGGR